MDERSSMPLTISLSIASSEASPAPLLCSTCRKNVQWEMVRAEHQTRLISHLEVYYSHFSLIEPASVSHQPRSKHRVVVVGANAQASLHTSKYINTAPTALHSSYLSRPRDLDLDTTATATSTYRENLSKRPRLQQPKCGSYPPSSPPPSSSLLPMLSTSRPPPPHPHQPNPAPSPAPPPSARANSPPRPAPHKSAP